MLRAKERRLRAGMRAAFTLVELLLVLVILSVLAAVVVPKFTGRSRQARETAARTDVAMLETVLDAYEIDTGGYPSTQQGLEALVEEPSGVRDWHGRYVDRLPTDPWGNPYIYKCPGDHNTDGYDLYSYGPDGRKGGDDDITNWAEE
jgi:general secretion pathway protein G